MCSDDERPVDTERQPAQDVPRAQIAGLHITTD